MATPKFQPLEELVFRIPPVDLAPDLTFWGGTGPSPGGLRPCGDDEIQSCEAAPRGSFVELRVLRGSKDAFALDDDPRRSHHRTVDRRRGTWH